MDTTTFQIIDEDQNFTGSLGSFMNHQCNNDILNNPESKYHVVSIFGSQSTGKSTLLNQLFGTSFEVMDASKGCSQTTKGIWVSRAKRLPILVMDVEGSDSIERGGNQDFERKAALFAMTTSEVVIFNLFANQVGRYEGANLSLLKTVFQVNLNLFQRQQRTKILIVIRDHNQEDSIPMERLQENLENNFKDIWKDLENPAALEIDTCIDFIFVRLNNAASRFTKKQFSQEVDNLRLQFFYEKSEDYVFTATSEFYKEIPAKKYHQFASDIWEKIQNVKDLNLPPKKILLAQYRCNEIFGAVLAQFTKTIKPLINKVCDQENYKGISSEELHRKIPVIINKAMASYDKDASSYAYDIYKEKRDQLLKIFQEKVLVIFDRQLFNIYKQALEVFDKEKKEAQNKHLNQADIDKKIASLCWTAKGYFLEHALEIANAINYKSPLESHCEYIRLKESLKVLSDTTLSVWESSEKLRKIKENLESQEQKTEGKSNFYGFWEGFGKGFGLATGIVFGIKKII